jgi:hypothetical protein
MGVLDVKGTADQPSPTARHTCLENAKSAVSGAFRSSGGTIWTH